MTTREQKSRWQKNWRDKNKAYRLVERKRRELLWKEAITSLKSRPCTDCGNRYPECVMDFDHLDRNTKRWSIADMKQLSIKTTLEEIAKCELVCANCHRIRTHKK